jgi:hypothetical protein
LQLQVCVLIPTTHVPRPAPQGLFWQLRLVHPVPLTVPSPLKPVGQVHMEGPVHVAAATHGVAAHWLVLDTH